MGSGQLILVPTPLNNDHFLSEEDLQVLKNSFPEEVKEKTNLMLVEELKIARRRWSLWGLPRRYFDEFLPYNEHTTDLEIENFLKFLQEGKTLFLMSDGGMPAVMDPGRKLISLCHDYGIRVKCLPIENSILMTMALSGFSLDRYYFAGFPPRNDDERKAFFLQHLKRKEPLICMDTPYRLKKLVQLLGKICPKRVAFLAMDLCSSEEKTLRGDCSELAKHSEKWGKREFVLILK